MSEDNTNPFLSEASPFDDANGASETEAAAEIEDFDQGGLLLKIATNGLSIPDYVKKLKEADILVAIDGQIYRDGPAKLKEMFVKGLENESKWLITIWRDGQVFDLLLTMPIESKFGLATEQETEWAMEEFQKHVYGDFKSYQNYEIYRDGANVCDVLSMEKDPMAFLFPVMWCMKYRLYPPLFALLVSYGITIFVNIILFVITYIVLSRFVYVSQNNIMRSFTLFESKNHYMTIAASNENDVSVIVKKIDPKNKIRFERHAIKAPKVVHKVILKEN